MGKKKTCKAKAFRIPESTAHILDMCRDAMRRVLRCSRCVSMKREADFSAGPAFPRDGKKRNSSRRDAGHSAKVLNIAYRFTGYPTAEQEVRLKNNIGGCRFLWNAMKADCDRALRETGERIYPTPAKYKKTEGLEWMRELDSLALCNVQLNLESAYSDWLSGDKGRPGFKKKGLAKDSYTTNKSTGSENLKLEGDMLTLPKVKDPIRVKCHRPVMPGAVLKKCTVTHMPDGRWMFTLLYEYEKPEEAYGSRLEEFFETGDISVLRHTGLDMSLPHMFVDSLGRFPSYENNGVAVTFDRHYRRLEKRIAREQRRLSRMEKGSSNYRKQCRKIASLHAKAKQQRTDFLHQVASRLAAAYDVISIEDLDLRAMKKALRLGKSVSDNGWGEFTSILEDKCRRNGHLLIRVGKWFPSSRTCLHCGHVHRDLALGERTYICPECGHTMDRDHQAAINIDNEGLNILKAYVTAASPAAEAA